MRRGLGPRLRILLSDTDPSSSLFLQLDSTLLPALRPICYITIKPFFGAITQRLAAPPAQCSWSSHGDSPVITKFMPPGPAGSDLDVQSRKSSKRPPVMVHGLSLPLWAKITADAQIRARWGSYVWRKQRYCYDPRSFQNPQCTARKSLTSSTFLHSVATNRSAPAAPMLHFDQDTTKSFAHPLASYGMILQSGSGDKCFNVRPSICRSSHMQGHQEFLASYVIHVSMTKAAHRD